MIIPIKKARFSLFLTPKDLKSGRNMWETMSVIVEIDSQGRVYIPASVRRRIRHRRFRVEVEGEAIVLRPVRPVIDKYYGIAGPAKYGSAEEVDEAVEEESRKAVLHDLRRC